MGDPVLRIQAELDQLSPEERVLVRAELGVGEEAVAEPREVAAAWQAEVEQALREVKDGSAELDDWDDVDRELEELVGSDRS
jgi:hypothetical protein